MSLEEAFKNIQIKYLTELPESFDNIEELVITMEKGEDFDENMRELQGKIHSLKGTSGTFELNFITTACHNLEDYMTARVGDDFKSYSQHIIDVNDLMREYAQNFQSLDQNKIEGLKTRLHAILSDVKEGDEAGPSRRILLNENFPIMVKIIQEALKPFNVQVSFSRNGYEALGRILNEHYDGIITSWESEIISGPNLAKMIRANDTVSPDLKIFLLTSHAEVKTKEGVDGILKKDVNLEKTLTETFSQMFGA